MDHLQETEKLGGGRLQRVARLDSGEQAFEDGIMDMHEMIAFADSINHI
jgi:hypothetical protein